MSTQEISGFGRSGRFVELSRYGGPRSASRGSLFSGMSPLSLHDRDAGRATVTRATLGTFVVGGVASTGHDVVVREAGAVSLVLPLRGTLITELGGTTRTAAAGSGLLLPRGIRKTRVQGAGDGPYAAYVLILPRDTLAVERHIDAAHGIALDATRSREAGHALQTFRFMTELLEADASLLDRPGAARSWCDLVAGALDQAVEALVGDAPSGDACAGPEAQRYVDRAEDYMRWNLADIATAADIAREVGVSRRTLENAFRRIRGEAPAKVLAAMRLQAARRMLLAPDGPASVTEVCLDCGIGHHGRFSAAYLAAFGEAPSTTLRRR